MTDDDRVKLLYGPYQAPLLKRSDRATYLFLNCKVVILGYQRLRWTPEAVRQRREELDIVNPAATR